MVTENVVDVGGAIIPGEELDVAAVDAWLKQQIPDLTGTPELTQYSGGASNWTYRLQYPEHDLILRRPPAGTKAASSHDMGREYKVQKALATIVDAIPEMVAFCDDPSVIGSEFYIMRRIEGIIPRRRMPRGVALSSDQARTLCENAINLWVQLHSIEPADVGLQDLGKGVGYNQRQIEGWARRYTDARTWNVPSFKKVIRWLEQRVPDESRICIIHNDFRLDNLILDPQDPTRIIGLLDWEMCTLGDPLMDLGNSLAYWTQADDDRFARSLSRQPTTLEGMLSRRELVDRYLQQSGLQVEDFTFYRVYGLFRLAGIVQQIYYRYYHGESKNKAFRMAWLYVNHLHHQCRRAIRTGD